MANSDNDYRLESFFFWLGRDADSDELETEEETAYDKWVREFVDRSRIDVV